MSRPRSRFAFLLLAVAAIALVAASSASAEGTTAFTCKGVAAGTGAFSDAHCTEHVGERSFSHRAVPSATETELTTTNAGTCEATKTACPLLLKSVQAGITLTIEAKKATGVGTLVNEEVGAEYVTRGTGSLTLEEVVVAAPAGKGCAVKGGTIKTTELESTTAGLGAFARTGPVSGSTIATLTVEGCSVVALNHEYTLKGSFKVTPHGATTEFAHTSVTEQNTLFLFEQKAGLEGKLTQKGRADSGQEYTPVANTEASAAEGTTAFTCKGVAAGTGAFSDAHCTEHVGERSFSHRAVPSATETELTTTNAGTCEATKTACPLLLKSVQSGVTLTIEAKKVTGVGTLVNEEVGAEHVTRGTGFLTLEEVAVTAPAGKGCSVVGGKIQTKELKTTTAGLGSFAKTEPVSGGVIAELTVESCSVSTLNHKYSLTGSFKVTPHGATTEFTHASITEQKTLFLFEQNAGLEGKLTQKTNVPATEFTPVGNTKFLSGTTAFTCKGVTAGTGTFFDAHCNEAVAEGGYAHESIAAGTETEVIRTNEGTCGETKTACPLLLKSVQSGVTLTIEAKKVTGLGTLVNEEVGAEHVTRGTGFLTLEEVAVTAPAGKGCSVVGGKIQTKELKTTTAGLGSFAKTEPVSGGVIAELTVEGCSVTALNHKYTLTGSFKVTPHGATTEFTHASVTEQGSLFLFEQKAGLEGKLTQKARVPAPSTPIANTEA